MENNIISRLNQIHRTAAATKVPAISTTPVSNENANETKAERTVKLLVTFSLPPSQMVPGPVSNVTLMEEIC